MRLVDEHAVPSLAELVDEGEGLVGLGEGGLGRLRSLDDSNVVVLVRVVAVLGLLAVRLAARGLTLRSGVLGYSDQHLSNAGSYGTQPTRVLDIRRCLF